AVVVAVLRKFPTVKFALAEGGIGWIPYWLERADYTYERHHWWTGQDFGDTLPSEVFKQRVLTCYIDDSTGLEMRHHIGVDHIAWECDYPHSDCTWPNAPEAAWKSFQAVGVPDDEIHKITWQNACNFYSFDPFAHRPRERCTVGALRAEAGDVDTTPKSFPKRGTGEAPKASLITGE
ncbi:MAG: amidohydrolase family protein, partial [Acidimicrobiales bacterium]